MVTVDVDTWEQSQGSSPVSLLTSEERILWDEYQVRPGIKLLVQNRPAVSEPCRFDFMIGEAPIEMLYCLSGKTALGLSDASGKHFNVTTRQGRYTLSYFPHTSGSSTTESGVPLQAVGLQISPEIFSQLTEMASYSRRWIREDGTMAPFFMEAPIPFPLQVTTRQIIECPLTGTRKSIFLEYKALELLYTQLGLLDATINENKGITSNEYEAANKAHDILMQTLNSPPSLKELARKVGMTHGRLNKVFRILFGATVFNVLREMRLECARRMLEDGKLNVAEVAYECGFSSPSHLSRAFSAVYGLQPKRYQTEIQKKQQFDE